MTAAAVMVPSLPSCGRRSGGLSKGTAAGDVARDFSFGPDGSFTVLQFTDTHHIIGDSRSQRALDCVNEALDGVKPDLVIHTGDIVFGKPTFYKGRFQIAHPEMERADKVELSKMGLQPYYNTTERMKKAACLILWMPSF